MDATDRLAPAGCFPCVCLRPHEHSLRPRERYETPPMGFSNNAAASRYERRTCRLKPSSAEAWEVPVKRRDTGGRTGTRHAREGAARGWTSRAGRRASSRLRSATVVSNRGSATHSARRPTAWSGRCPPPARGRFDCQCRVMAHRRARRLGHRSEGMLVSVVWPLPAWQRPRRSRAQSRRFAVPRRSAAGL